MLTLNQSLQIHPSWSVSPVVVWVLANCWDQPVLLDFGRSSPSSDVDAEPEPANPSLIAVVNSGCLGTGELLKTTCSIFFYWISPVYSFCHQVQQSLITTLVTDSEQQMVIWAWMSDKWQHSHSTWLHYMFSSSFPFFLEYVQQNMKTDSVLLK